MIASRLTATAILAALLIGAPDASRAQDGIRWRAPVSPVAVVRHFDPPAHRWLPGHRGVDLRTTVGAAVRAAGSGRVTFAGTLAGRGVVTVDHGTLRTTYEPVEALVDPRAAGARGRDDRAHRDRDRPLRLGALPAPRTAARS